MRSACCGLALKARSKALSLLLEALKSPPMGVFDVQFVCDHIDPRDFPVCVETGTCLGYSTTVIGDLFAAVYTIELDPELHRAAEAKFAAAQNIVCIHGDSAEQLQKLLPTLTAPTVFYLDAHWSGDGRVDWSASSWKGYGVATGHRSNVEGALPSSWEQVPLMEEVQAILQYPHACVIYVDDLDKFSSGGQGRTDKGFKGEDWSHVNWFTIVELCRPRLKAEKYKGGYQALLVLEALNTDEGGV